MLSLLVFYAIPAAVLYSSIQTKRCDKSIRCLNGHHVPPAKFCEECGALVPSLVNPGCSADYTKNRS
jgi:hypothetical protein